MFALEVEYLTGRVFASRREDRRAVEWPPHPARLFAALVAAYKECDLGVDARAALEWLEALPPPRICAHPPDHRGWVRDVHDIFVPVNDASHLPERRSRQVRWFPSFAPQDPRLWFAWPQAEGFERIREALQRIAENVSYLGHSMSPVRIAVKQDAPMATLEPDNAGNIILRTTGAGRLTYLESIHEQRERNATIQPRLGKTTRYRIADGNECPTLAQSVFRHGFVLQKKTGPTVPACDAISLVSVVRKAVMQLIPDPLPEIISGHDATGAKSARPHLAITALPNVGHLHADGNLMGCALWLPDSATDDERDLLEEVLSKIETLTLGKHGVWRVKRMDGYEASSPQVTLRPSTYSRACETWASVTPVIFGHYPKSAKVGPNKSGGKVFAEICEMVGLPAPIEARIGPVSAFSGAAKASEFSRPKQASSRLMAHVWLRFAQPVKGPVLLGAGRHFGFGLCRPHVPRKTHEA